MSEGTEGGPLLARRTAVEGTDQVAVTLVLNRPDQLNAIDWPMLDALDRALDDVVGDPAVRGVLVTGAGRAFSAGGDLVGYQTLQRDPGAVPSFRRGAAPDLRPVAHVARARGRARERCRGRRRSASSSSTATLRSRRGRRASVMPTSTSDRWVAAACSRSCPARSAGRAAAELVFTGRFLDADEAADWGLVNRVVDDDALLAAGAELVAGFATKSPLAMTNAKDVMMSLWADNGSVDAGLRYERERNSYYCLTSDDAVEGLAAFAEKRPPEFRGS